jgi:hypothetical protein
MGVSSKYFNNKLWNIIEKDYLFGGMMEVLRITGEREMVT